MTSREKAIEAFQNIQADLIDYADILENSTYSTHEDVEIVLEQLKKPSLDDAIKVVEEKLSKSRKYKKEPMNNYEVVKEAQWTTKRKTLRQVLTALKGLKGETK